MLRSEHSIVHHDFDTMRVRPDRLRRRADATWLPAVARAIAIYRNAAGSTRQELHDRVAACLEDLRGCVPRRISSICKLLDDAGTFDKATGDAAKLRRRVFTLAAPMHPIVNQRSGVFEHSIDDARQRIANELGLPFEKIAGAMFADVIELQRLVSFDETLDAAGLLSRYNVAQTQALLYRAASIKLDFSDRAPFIVRMAKLAGLMHRITRLDIAGEPSYSMILDGPGSVLRGTWRYGIRFAQLIPSLLCCNHWRLTAKIRPPGGIHDRVMRFDLSPADGLRAEQSGPTEFDSQLERDVEKRWREDPANGWTLSRDREFLTLGQQVYTPDFVLRESKTQRRIFIEVLGYWTPEYLEDKRQRLEKFSAATPGAAWLLMVGKKPTSEKQGMLDEVDLPVIVHGKRVKPQDWIRTVQQAGQLASK